MAQLRSARARVEQWALDDCDDDTLVAGAARAYARGREAFAAARQDPSPERLHDWRKRVKDLWYRQRLLADAWPGPVKAFADECDRLGELLGDDHDLAVLAALLSAADADAEAAPPSVNVNRMLELIAARRDQLKDEAFALGRHVYAEKPKAFARRMDVYLTTARAREQEPQTA